MGIRLKKIDESMLEKIMHWRMMPEVTKFMYNDPTLTFESQKAWFEGININETVKYWVIEVDSTDIGVLSLNDIDLINLRCAWAYYIADTSFRGRGLARILECNIYDYVFARLNLNKLWCEVFCFNETVIKLHQKFGSVVEGTLKQHIFKNGEFMDIVRMGITKDIWDNIKYNYKYEIIDIE